VADRPLPTTSPDDPGALPAAADALRSGAAIVVPTDTVYGLAVLASIDGAVGQLFELKERSQGQPIAVLVADAAQARSIAQLPPEAERWADELWPGALTIVAPRAPALVGTDLGGAPDTVGVRCPAHDFVRALAAEVGPLATTSANRSGEATPTTASAAAAALTGPVALVVDGGPAGTVASTVVDVTVAPWRVLREGAITAERLARLAR
jgi:L-threonylcarbamoyladenylate synthase